MLFLPSGMGAQPAFQKPDDFGVLGCDRVGVLVCVQRAEPPVATTKIIEARHSLSRFVAAPLTVGVGLVTAIPAVTPARLLLPFAVPPVQGEINRNGTVLAPRWHCARPLKPVGASDRTCRRLPHNAGRAWRGGRSAVVPTGDPSDATDERVRDSAPEAPTVWKEP